MTQRSTRLAVRAVIVHRARLLLVNAFPGRRSDLWCAPGGGVEPGQSLHDNLRREVSEETGLEVVVGSPCLVNEFHDPSSGFHQVELFFRCTLRDPATDPRIDPAWRDPQGVVNRHRWVGQADYAALRVKPDALGALAFNPARALSYDPLERIVR